MKNARRPKTSSLRLITPATRRARAPVKNIAAAEQSSFIATARHTNSSKDTMTSKTHLVLQGKGGVGKSLIASVLAQWLTSKGRTPLCIDTDPVNRTFSGYAALKVQAVDILQDDEINPRRFDDLIEHVDAATSDVIVDNGASSFVPLSHYLLSNDVPALLAERQHQLVIHTVVTGGQALQDTLHGFTQLAAQFPASVDLVVWLNPYWGPIVHEGKEFEQLKSYTAHRDRVTAIVRIPTLKPETFGTDLINMLRARLTFEEALAALDRTIMERQRLKRIRDDLFGLLSASTL
jgi:hypothetical protein